ncbi:alpha-L-rhamnosidase C-terminal domain-containing protein [Streptomyces echinatus]|uniref:alpha-L-rhamnosidase C-terminal domain-containing protein n=1 Tax=Streptomyces echinatus TaxID=67293 RepID=UPI0031EA1C34
MPTPPTAPCCNAASPAGGYMIDHGATTIWERWDGIRADGSFNDPGMNSFNHYGLGSVGDFLYRQVGGLGPARPGYAALRVAPRPGGGLTSAESTYETPYGEAASAWSVSGNRLTLRVTVPGQHLRHRHGPHLAPAVGRRTRAGRAGGSGELPPAGRDLHLHRGGLTAGEGAPADPTTGGATPARPPRVVRSGPANGPGPPRHPPGPRDGPRDGRAGRSAGRRPPDVRAPEGALPG